MSTTFSFTAKDEDAFYTLAQINAQFDAIALVLNAKLDVDDEDTLDGNLNVGDAEIVNLAPAVDANDAITYEQLAAGAAQVV